MKTKKLSDFPRPAYMGAQPMTKHQMLLEARQQHDHPLVIALLQAIAKEEKISFDKAYQLYY